MTPVYQALKVGTKFTVTFGGKVKVVMIKVTNANARRLKDGEWKSMLAHEEVEPIRER